MRNTEDEHNASTQPMFRQNSDTQADYQDEIVTPPPNVPLGTGWGETRRPGSSCALRAVVALCLVLSLLSLALSSFLMYSLLVARQTGIQALDAAIAAVDNFGGEGFQYEYHFEQTIPVSATIPIKQDLVFPFKGALPINTTVKVPIDAGVLGSFVVEVPINTTVNVDTSVPIHVDQTFHIDTTIPVNMTIPIDIRPDDPQIQKLLSEVQGWLMRMRSSFY